MIKVIAIPATFFPNLTKMIQIINKTIQSIANSVDIN